MSYVHVTNHSLAHTPHICVLLHPDVLLKLHYSKAIASAAAPHLCLVSWPQLPQESPEGVIHLLMHQRKHTRHQLKVAAAPEHTGHIAQHSTA